jgi:CheY-like chemotaxis protein
MKKILLVEDEVDIAEVLRDVLELRGFVVVLAFDGREGLAAARAHRPDLVITDLMMPAMDGIELIESIRQLPDLARMPIIAISAAPYEGDELFLRKPFDVYELVELAQRALGSCADQGR